MKKYLLSVLLCLPVFGFAAPSDSSTVFTSLASEDGVSTDQSIKYCIVTIVNKSKHNVEVFALFPSGDKALKGIIPKGKTHCFINEGCIINWKMDFRHRLYPSKKKKESQKQWKHYKLKPNKTRHDTCEDGRHYTLRNKGKNKVWLD